MARRSAQSKVSMRSSDDALTKGNMLRGKTELRRTIVSNRPTSNGKWRCACVYSPTNICESDVPQYRRFWYR
jgi:hypothetical protein